MSLLTAAAGAAHRTFPRAAPPPPPSSQPLPTLEVGQVPAFGHRRIAVPSGHGTPQQVLLQGTGSRAYIRRPGRKATDVGRIDVFARDRIGTETVVVATDRGALNLVVTVTDPDLHTTKRYVDAEIGDDGNSGTSPGGGAWRTWAHACANAPANSTVILKGRRTDGRVQVYNIPWNAGWAATVANSNVEFKADPDDVAAGFKPMIWTEGDIYRRYLEDNQGRWESDGTGNNVWRTTASDLPSATHTGVFYKAPNGRWVKLFYLPVGGLSQLRRREEGQEGPRDTMYPGPACYRSGGRLYARVEDCTDTKVYAGPGQSGTRDWDWSATGTGWLPASLDLNDLELLVVATPEGGLGSATTLVRVEDKTNVVFKNLIFAGGGYGVYHEDCTNCRELGCEFFQISPDFGELGTANISHTSVCVFWNGVCRDMLVDRCSLQGGWAPWVGFREMKGYWSSGASMRSSAFNMRDPRPNEHENIVVRNSIVTQFGMHWMWSVVSHNMLFHNNELSWSPVDGGFISHPTDVSNMRFLRNLMWGVTLWGPPWENAGGWDDNQWYYGFNLVTPGYWTYQDPGYRSGDGDGRRLRRMNVGHGGQTAVGRQMYHNTTFFGPSADTDDGRIPGHGFPLGDGRPFDGGSGRCMGFNNILAYQAKAERHAGGTNSGRDAIVTLLSAENGGEQDGNHYDMRGGMGYLGSGRRVHAAVVQTSSGWPPSFTFCDDLSDIRSAGFEANGSEGDSGFAGAPSWPEPHDAEAYMLAEGSPCRTGAVGLAGRPWFRDMDGFEEITRTLDCPHRGALDPDVPLLEQAVGPL